MGPVVAVFALGYLLIALESPLKLPKAPVALLTAAAAWIVLAAVAGGEAAAGIVPALSDTAAIIFFLMGAMAIVEIVGAHGGFRAIAAGIRTRRRIPLLWIISFASFLLSSVLDNLTTTIVMVALANALFRGREERLYASGMIVIAANAGGAWTPIGDVTTTMLWIGDRISALGIMGAIVLPSLLNLVVPLSVSSLMLARAAKKAGAAAGPPAVAAPGGEGKPEARGASRAEGYAVLCLGVGALVFVPAFRALTGLPPWLGMLLGLGLLWIVVTLMHRGKAAEERERLSAAGALGRIDHASLLFFIGILLAVAALERTGALAMLSGALDSVFGGSRGWIASVLGLFSAVIDNVPLVAASMGLYDPAVVPRDHAFWELLAYCAGTGGSVLIIGSAAGVAAMGIQKISFGWYLKRFAPLALLGYAAGIGAYALLRGWA